MAIVCGALILLVAVPLRLAWIEHGRLPLCPPGQPPPQPPPPLRSVLTQAEITIARSVVAGDPTLVEIAHGQAVTIVGVGVSSDPYNGTDAAVTLAWPAPTEAPARLFFGPPHTGPATATAVPGTMANLTQVTALVSPVSRRIVGFMPGPGAIGRHLGKASCISRD